MPAADSPAQLGFDPIMQSGFCSLASPTTNPVVPAAKFTGRQTLDGAVTRSLVLGRIIGIDVLRITRDRRTRSLIGPSRPRRLVPH